MRAVVMRVARAEVRVGEERVGSIGRGLLVLLGVADEDGDNEVAWMARKVAELRIFPDESGRMNHSVEEVSGELLVVSQFTLLGDVRRGRRPSYVRAAAPERADALYEQVMESLRGRGLIVASGRFQAMMDVELVNDGPVTIILDTAITR